MHEAILRAGEESADALLTSRRLGRTGTCDSWTAHREKKYPGNVFQAIAALVYDMEWTNSGEGDGGPDFKNAEVLADAANTISPNFDLDYDNLPAIFALMLHVDYGFPAYPIFGHPEEHVRLDILWSLERFTGFLAATA